MDVSKLRLQTAAVLALVLLVSWPTFRPVRAVTIWRSGGPLTPQPELVTNDRRWQADNESSAAAGRRAADSAWSETGAANRDSGPAVVDGRNRNAQGSGLRRVSQRISSIVGRARTTLNTPIPYARLLLRNIATGRIEARATADSNGQFAFTDVIPSGYIIEMLGADGTVIAASELMAMAGGGMRQATIRVPTGTTPRAIFGSVVGSTSGSTTGSTFGSTTGEPVTRAVETGTRPTSEPQTVSSPNF